MRVDVGGYALNVATTPGDPGRPVIFLHGLAGTRDDWADVVPFAPPSVAHAVDLLGHGRSDDPADPAAYGFDAVSDALVRLADGLGAAAPVWVGYSFGARLLLGLALRHPGRVGGLVLESVHPGLGDPDERRRRRLQDEDDARLLESQGVAAFLERWHARPAFQTRRDKAGWALEEQRKLATNRAPALAGCLRGLGLGAQPPLMGELGRLAAPTLLVCGTLDPEYCDLAHAMQKRMPKARLEAVPSVGHGVHVEDPEAFGDRLRQFQEALPVPWVAPGSARGA